MKRRGASFAAAYERFSALKSGMSAPDQSRVQQHFDAYRDVEGRLTRAPDLTNLACHSSDMPPSQLNLGDPLKLSDRMQLMVDQAVLALACDVSRVLTLSWTFAATNQIFSFLPGFDTPTGSDGSPSPDGHHPAVTTRTTAPMIHRPPVIARRTRSSVASSVGTRNACRRSSLRWVMCVSPMVRRCSTTRWWSSSTS